MKETLTERMRDGAAEIERLEAENATLRAAQKACELCGPNLPRWEDGEPANLEAAAEDAKEWLIVFEQFVKSRRTTMYLELNDAKKLNRCIEALRKFVANG